MTVVTAIIYKAQKKPTLHIRPSKLLLSCIKETRHLWRCNGFGVSFFSMLQEVGGKRFFTWRVLWLYTSMDVKKLTFKNNRLRWKKFCENVFCQIINFQTGGQIPVLACWTLAFQLWSIHVLKFCYTQIDSDIAGAVSIEIIVT